MADVDFRFRVDDTNVEKVMADIANQVERTDQDFKQLERSATDALNNVGQEAAQSEQQVKDFADQTTKAARAAKEAEQETGRFSRGLRTLFGNLSVGGVSLNDLADGLKNTKEGLNDVAGASGKAGQGFGVLRGGALALVAIVGAALVAAFAKFQGNLDRVRVGLAQAKVALDVGITALGKWGNAIIQAATGQKTLRDALQEAKRETAGLNEEIRRQIALEGQLEQQRIGLERRTQEQAAFASLQKQEIERLNLIADNTTKSFREREQAAKRRQTLSEEIGRAEEKRLLTEIALTARVSGGQQQQLKTARQIADLAKEGILTTENLANRIAKTGISQADAFKRASEIFGIIGELGDAQETLLGIQSEAFNQAQSIRAEQAQAAEQRKKELEDAQKRLLEIIRITTDAEAQIGGAGRVAAQEFANATDEIVKLQEEYTKLAAQFATGETAADIERIFQPLKDIAEGKFNVASFGGAFEALPSALENIVLQSDALAPFNERLRQEGLKAGEALAKATKDGAARGLNAQGLAELNTQAKQLAASLGQAALDGLFEAEDARFELQLSRQDALISKLSEKVDATKQALAEEEKLQQEGFANNAAALKKQLAEEERERRLAEEKKLEIERKAAKQRALIAAGEQAVQLTLAAARLAADGAKTGVVGLVVALGALGILFRIMSAARAQAASEASKTAAFATGTEYVDGAGTGTSDSIRARLSKGERVITARDNETLGGRTMSNKELVRYALLGQRVHSDPLFAFAMGLRGQQSKLEESKLTLQVEAMKDAYKDAALLAAEKQIEYWKTRPVEYRNAAGEMVREWVDGNRVVRQIEQQNEE